AAFLAVPFAALDCARFFDTFFLPGNALRSKWVPWELGYADPVKTMGNIAILPVADEYGHWRGSEYVGVYPRMERVDGKWQVVPHGQKTGKSLNVWLKG
ncbi:unnamed protein product, partial [marine sediment metagenome]